MAERPLARIGLHGRHNDEQLGYAVPTLFPFPAQLRGQLKAASQLPMHLVSHAQSTHAVSCLFGTFGQFFGLGEQLGVPAAEAL